MALGDTNHWEFTPGTATAGSGGVPIQEEDDMTPEQDARLKLIEMAVVRFPGDGTAASRLEVPGQKYDWLPAISNQIGGLDFAGLRTSIVNGVVAALPAGGNHDVPAIAAAVDAVLADNFAAIPKPPTTFIAQ